MDGFAYVLEQLRGDDCRRLRALCRGRPARPTAVHSVRRIGSALPERDTLVGFGAAALMTEVTPAGQVLWEGRLTVDGQPVPYFYRVRRVASLYRYERP